MNEKKLTSKDCILHHDFTSLPEKTHTSKEKPHMGSH